MCCCLYLKEYQMGQFPFHFRKRKDFVGLYVNQIFNRTDRLVKSVKFFNVFENINIIHFTKQLHVSKLFVVYKTVIRLKIFYFHSYLLKKRSRRSPNASTAPTESSSAKRHKSEWSYSRSRYGVKGEGDKWKG